MKRIGNLKKKFCNKEIILEAIRFNTTSDKTRSRTKKKNGMKEIDKWNKIVVNKDTVAENIQNELWNMTYIYGDFKKFKIKEKNKLRDIYASEPYDQIVDYVLTEALKYVYFEKKPGSIPNESYGSIKNKGHHRLREEVSEKIAKNRNFAVVCDIKKYYPTINRSILMEILEKSIKDKWLLWLLSITLEREPGEIGLPLGMSCSNILSHIYHENLDWEIMNKFGKENYRRFCDDVILFSKTRKLMLLKVRYLIDKTSKDLKQTIKQDWRIVDLNNKNDGINFLGMRLNGTFARLKPSRRKEIEKRFTNVQKEKFSETNEDDVIRMLGIWAGIKGGLKGLNIDNLLHHWYKNKKYNLFFMRLKKSMTYINEKRKEKTKNKKK